MNTSTTSSAGNYSLTNEFNRVSIYVYPMIIILILSSNVMNVMILTRPALRLSSCTYYFLALAITSLIFVFIGPLTTFLNNAYNLSVYSSPFGCRIQSYLIYSTVLYFTVILACASFDRFCASSTSVRLRRFSHPRIARRVILITALLVVIYMSPFSWTNSWDSLLNLCVQYSNTVVVVYLVSRIIVYCLVGPFIMALFGILTIRNIHKQRLRVSPLTGSNRSRRTEGQLNRMLIIQVGAHLLFSLPAGVTYTLVTFTPSLVTPLLTGIRSITILWQTGTFFLSFFFYILSAGVYRAEMKKILCANRRRILLRRTLQWFLSSFLFNTRIFNRSDQV